MKSGQTGERGATLVEAAISYGLLFLAIFAIIEFGLGFKDWLSVSHASREGARAGATFGQDPNADFQILQEIESVLNPVGLPTGSRVRVFDASPGGLSTTYTYQPGYDDLTDPGWTGTPNPLPGSCDWNPCPQPGRSTYEPDCVAFPGSCAPRWPTNTRDVGAPVTDRIGVEVSFTHDWITGLFGTTTDFTTATDFQLEPQLFD